MAPKRPEDALIVLFRSVRSNTHRNRLWTTPTPCARFSSLTVRPRDASDAPGASSPTKAARLQCYSSQARPRRNIAVVGGGLTGLTAAHYLARHAGDANITLYEGSSKLGGWVDNQEVSTPYGPVFFQSGPRTLRSWATTPKYDDLVLYDVISTLQIRHKIRLANPNASDRYIYYPDHLVKLPTLANGRAAFVLDLLKLLLTEPLFSGVFKAILRTATIQLPRHDNTPSDISRLCSHDESLREFVCRMNGDYRLADNVVSATMHGILGADISKISAKNSPADFAWYWSKGLASGDRGMVTRKDHHLLPDILCGNNREEIIQLAQDAAGWSMFTFEKGLSTLLEALHEDLMHQPNVTIRTGEPVTSLTPSKSQTSVQVSTPKRKQAYHHVVSTVTAKKLYQLSSNKTSLGALAETHDVTIMVVNLFYPNPALLQDNHGFGYLIPTTAENNEEGALGVIFDSDVEIPNENETPGTKLTVMLGGHYWDDYQLYPTEEMGIQMAKHVVQRHLGIPEDEEVFGRAKLCRECIPQHYVGHRSRMQRAESGLAQTFGPALTVAGPSYTGVGVIPAMRAGFDAGMRVATGRGPPWFHRPNAPGAFGHGDDWTRLMGAETKVNDHVGTTGLQDFVRGEVPDPVWKSKREMELKKWSMIRQRKDEPSS